MRRIYKLEKPEQATLTASFTYWRERRQEIVQLMLLGPVEVDLTAARHVTRAQLSVLLKGIHTDAKIKEEHYDIILTVSHPNPEVVAIAMAEYNDGICPAAQQG